MDNLTTPDPYLSWTAAELLAEAAGWRDAIYGPGEPGYCNPNTVFWTYNPQYDISKLQHLMPHRWQAWFQQEQLDAAEDGREGYYDNMLDRPIAEAIIVLERDGKGYIWDGWHRTGAAITRQLGTLRAIVGIAPD